MNRFHTTHGSRSLLSPRYALMALLEFSMTPLGLGESVSGYVARCVKLVEQSGLDFELHAMGTIVEGEIDELLALLQQCFDALAPDCHRISCTAKFDYRQGATGRIQGKVASVEQQLKHPGNHH